MILTPPPGTTPPHFTEQSSCGWFCQQTGVTLCLGEYVRSEWGFSQLAWLDWMTSCLPINVCIFGRRWFKTCFYCSKPSVSKRGVALPSPSWRLSTCTQKNSVIPNRQNGLLFVCSNRFFFIIGYLNDMFSKSSSHNKILTI